MAALLAMYFSIDGEKQNNNFSDVFIETYLYTQMPKFHVWIFGFHSIPVALGGQAKSEHGYRIELITYHSCWPSVWLHVGTIWQNLLLFTEHKAAICVKLTTKRCPM